MKIFATNYLEPMSEDINCESDWSLKFVTDENKTLLVRPTKTKSMIKIIKVIWMKLYCNSCDGIYHEFLDVRFGRQCDNNCSFCIEKAGVDDKGIDVDKLIKSTLESGKKGVLILGGEWKSSRIYKRHKRTYKIYLSHNFVAKNNWF